MKVGDLIKLKIQYAAEPKEKRPYGIVIEVDGDYAEIIWLRKNLVVLNFFELIDFHEVISEAQ